MKKILSALIIIALMVLLSGCTKNLDGEVKLISLQSEENIESKNSYIKNNNTTDGNENTQPSETTLPSEDTQPSETVESTTTKEHIEYQYKILDVNEETINIKMTLDNPKNYYIFDFKLVSNNEDLEILIDDDFVKLNSIQSIRWNGVTNESTFFTLKINSNQDTELNLDNIYFSDKTNGENRFEVDLNNKSEFLIYKVEPLLVELKHYDDGKFYYNVTHDSRIKVENLNGNEFISNDQDFVLNYNYNLGNIIVNDSHMEYGSYQDLLKIGYINDEDTFIIYIEVNKFLNVDDLKIKVINAGNVFHSFDGLGTSEYKEKVGHVIHGSSLDYMTIEVSTNGFRYKVEVLNG